MEETTDKDMLQFTQRNHPHPDDDNAVDQGVDVNPADLKAARFQNFDPAAPTGARERKMDLLLDLSLPVSVELGRTNMLIRDVLDLQRGSIVEFDKLTSEPVDIVINGKKVAEGEVVVLDKHFGIRVTNLVEPSERLKSLGK